MTRIRIGEWQAAARSALSSVDENPGLIAQLLLAHTTAQTRSWVLAHPETELNDEQHTLLDQYLANLIQGMPLAYLTGRQEFFGLTFAVSPAVLIPRPETEHLVERALAWLTAEHPAGRAADIGTGSGCIAVSLARHVPNLRIDALDRSMAALQIAAKNVRAHGVENQVRLIAGDLTTALRGPYSLICANLPYIPTGDLTGLPVARHEPLEALDGGEDGLNLISRLLQDARRLLWPGSRMLLEIEYRQAAAVTRLAQNIYPSAAISVHADLAGLDRLVDIRV